MASRSWRPEQGSLTDGVVTLHGKVTTSTSGTIGSQSCRGFTVAKDASEAGRYTVTLEDDYNSLLNVLVTLEADAADTAYTTDKGQMVILREVAVNGSDQTFKIQFTTGDSQADAEVEDAAVFYITIWLKNSSL
jgi:hypothetical protein